MFNRINKNKTHSNRIIPQVKIVNHLKTESMNISLIVQTIDLFS